MNYYKAPADWTPSAPNPFSADGRYGPEWTCFRIDGVNRTICCSGGGKKGIFTFILGADTPWLKCHLADFLRYEKRHNRNVIISCPESINLGALVEQALAETPNEDCVRPTDPRWAVHSTTSAAWHDICRDGMLKSIALLHEEGKETTGLGIEELGEPPDYSEHIVLGQVEGMAPEFVVASRGRGRIVTEPDQPYEPGVRIYFDSHLIIRNGLAVRDGLHLAKVHQRLPLSPYGVAAITAGDFPQQTWRPRTFLKAANDLFLGRMSGEMKESDRTGAGS